MQNSIVLCPPCRCDLTAFMAASAPHWLFRGLTAPMVETPLRLGKLLQGPDNSYHHCVRITRRHVTTASSKAQTGDQKVSSLPVLQSILGAILKPYLRRNPTAVTALDLIREEEQGPVQYDHFAFRTFGAGGCGIAALSQIFLDFGYTQRDELQFPAKKLKAYWFAPSQVGTEFPDRDGVIGPLPRVFISELQVENLSPAAQDTIYKYTTVGGQLAQHAATSSLLGDLLWPTPTVEDYRQLASESEYAAWTLVNGYALNHTTVSVHNLRSHLREIKALNSFLQENAELNFNTEGGILKVSPDGGLLQSSTVADSVMYKFANGIVDKVPASYIEFAERLVLPEFSHLPPNEVREHHRREGFEVGNADKIFESTYSKPSTMTL